MVVSTALGGLGNRIKSWVSASRLDPDAKVRWELNDNMPAMFSQLFLNDCSVDSIPDEADVHTSWRLPVLPQDEAHLPEGFTTVGAGIHPLIRGLGKIWWNFSGQRTDRYRYMIFPQYHSDAGSRTDARLIDLEYERIPKYFRDIYAPLFARIKFHPDIGERADEWSNSNLDGGVIGLQVRTWRDSPRRHRKYYQPAAKRLSRLIANTDKNDRFLVVSDSDDIATSLADQYGNNRILHFPRQTSRSISWQSPEAMQEDLLEMVLLSRTNRLFASYLSTFSETAWWLGGATASVDVY
jgi:hypothetical protein